MNFLNDSALFGSIVPDNNLISEGNMILGTNDANDESEGEDVVYEAEDGDVNGNVNRDSFNDNDDEETTDTVQQ
jgi:hypothetical protein